MTGSRQNSSTGSQGPAARTLFSLMRSHGRSHRCSLLLHAQAPAAAQTRGPNRGQRGSGRLQAALRALTGGGSAAECAARRRRGLAGGWPGAPRGSQRAPRPAAPPRPAGRCRPRRPAPRAPEAPLTGAAPCEGGCEEEEEAGKGLRSGSCSCEREETGDKRQRKALGERRDRPPPRRLCPPWRSPCGRQLPLGGCLAPSLPRGAGEGGGGRWPGPPVPRRGLRVARPLGC